VCILVLSWRAYITDFLRVMDMETIKQYEEFIMPISKGMDPFVVESAEGATIKDTEGRTYIDCFSGLSVINVGHRNPHVIEAIKKQLEKHLHCCSYVYYLQTVGELAEKLAEITPEGLKKSFFSNSGAEAVEGAMKLARKYTGKKEFISLTYSFHGRTFGALTLTGQKKYKNKMGPFLTGVTYADAPYCFRCKYRLEYPECDLECARSLERIIGTTSSGDVAGMFIEPVLGEGGIIHPPDGEYFRIIHEILKENDSLFIVDEVQTGFGRCGRMFASEIWDLKPDIMPLAKGIAGGLPLGAFIAKEEIADAFESGDHLSTFGGNPVSCAAALGNIKALKEDGLIENSKKIGEFFKNELLELKEKYPVVGDVRGKGLMIGVELAEQHTKKPLVDLADKVKNKMREDGILIGKGGYYNCTLRFQPPLVITKEQVECAISSLDKSLKKYT